ncbi:MAG: thioredoxin domain-containing protein [Gammaproteobacteria bacterium]|nr:thioredoxin domain-containing protein [Gammaproteobacteria bacterium]
MKDSSGNKSLEEQLRSSESAKEGDYDKRTEHLHEDGTAVFINRLVREDSPYLLQHAHNPVNWFPWGKEAFEVAKKENKPIFLSIGYSTCHWCHVMEVESFDNVEIAKVLNEHFISVKMDREQYPDIDEVYMTGVQLMSGHGGWPMSNFLLSDGRPFFAATYFPPPTFMKLLHQIVEAWEEKYAELESSAIKIGEAIDRILSERKQASSLDSAIHDHVSQALFQREDRALGGLVGAPKFPQEPLLLFMLDRARRQRHVQAMEFASRSLDAMGRGGIYDQVGGGFHRYSVDAEWLVPHFEKMLYNQSQLTLAYLQAYQLTGNPFFQRICFQTLEYVLRDMQLPEGGFYSATDADSEGAEGVFFLWTIDEVKKVLDENEADLVLKIFGLSELGNFEGSNILNLSKSFAHHAEEYGAEFTKNLDRVLNKLYLAREQRIHPIRDDKLIVAWSAAMAASLALAGDYFKQKHWIAAAEKAVILMLGKNLDEQGNLRRIYLNGTSSIAGQLEDYANLSQALITLFDVTTNQSYLEKANRLMSACLERFWDEEEKGFFLSPANQQGPQLTRSRSASDGATLSPVATALNCLIDLRDRSALLTTEAQSLYSEKADQCAASLVGDINDNAMSHTSMLRQLSSIDEGSNALTQYLDGGLLRIKANQSTSEDGRSKEVTLLISISEGWHITAPGAHKEQYKPLRVEVTDSEQHWSIKAIKYPESQKTLSDESLSVYEGSIELMISLQRTAQSIDELGFSVAIACELQLCNDRHCLLPGTKTFRV